MRVATLLAVIVNMIGFDATSLINCQVNPRRMSLFLIPRADRLRSQGLGYFRTREHVGRDQESVNITFFSSSLTLTLPFPAQSS